MEPAATGAHGRTRTPTHQRQAATKINNQVDQPTRHMNHQGLMGSDAGFITGSEFLMDGGVTAAYRFGELAPE